VQPLEVVWYLFLKVATEGPALIFYAALTDLVSSHRTSFYVHLRHTCLSPRKGPFQTLVKQNPEFLHFALFPLKTEENGLKSGVKV
jgi:hypothetical protein